MSKCNYTTGKNVICQQKKQKTTIYLYFYIFSFMTPSALNPSLISYILDCKIYNSIVQL